MDRLPTRYDALRDRLLGLLGRAAGRLGERAGSWALVGADIVALSSRVVADERVPVAIRGEVIGAALFVISPFEIVPAALFGPVGIVDDAVVLTRLLDTLLNKVEAEILRDHWPGDPATLARLQAVAREGRRLFSTGARDGVRRLVSRGALAAGRRMLSLLPPALARRGAAPGTRLALRSHVE